MSEQTMTNGAKLVLEKLIEQGVTTVFGYPGGAVIPLYHELVNYKEQLTHFRASHEQHAVHAADGYARSTGKVGVCLVTSGPGATNTITGIATAFMDSIPMVVLCGQVPSALIGKDAFQEVDITSMTLAITKHNFLVRRFDELESTLEKAFKIAQSGRPGPVLVDIPKDLLTMKVPIDSTTECLEMLKIAAQRQNKLSQDTQIGANVSELKRMSQWVNSSMRPLIYCGGGVKASGAEDMVKKLAERLQAPVINSLMGLGTMDRRHELSVGMAGMHGCKAANEAINNCDVLLALGVRFSDRVIGNPKQFGIQAKIIHIDLDPTEHEKNLKVDLRVAGDVKTILEQLLPYIKEKNSLNGTCNDGQNSKLWKEIVRQWAEQYPLRSEADWVFDTLNNLDKGQTIYATDVGQHQMWSAQKLLIRYSKHWLSSGGLGTMGFGLGAAIGAKVGNPDKRVILITGDGSFRMNLQELATLMDYQLKVDIVLFDNRALGMVRQWQNLFQSQVYSETEISGNLDYERLAQAFGLQAFYAANGEDLSLALKTAEALSGSTLTVVDIPHNACVFPIVPPGKGLEAALEA